MGLAETSSTTANDVPLVADQRMQHHLALNPVLARFPGYFGCTFLTTSPAVTPCATRTRCGSSGCCCGDLALRCSGLVLRS